MEGFAMAYPEIEIRYRDMPFPTSPTSSWLGDVDVAVCHLPPPDEAVWSKVVRREPRVALIPAGHPLAAREQLDVAELLDETYIGFSPSVDPAWAGFWSLDDHRGGPPGDVTDDHATNPQEVLAALGAGDGDHDRAAGGRERALQRARGHSGDPRARRGAGAHRARRPPRHGATRWWRPCSPTRTGRSGPRGRASATGRRPAER